jgi:hypothetical protein
LEKRRGMPVQKRGGECPFKKEEGNARSKKGRGMPVQKRGGE